MMQDQAKKNIWFQRVLLIAIVLGCAVAMSPNVVGPDIWGHVQYGRDVFTDGYFAPTTTYSFTAEGYRWINHENFSEILMAVGADTVGAVGLSVAKVLLSLLVIGLIVRHAMTHGVHLLTICAVALLVAVNMAFHWSVRPQLMSYTFFTLMVVLLLYCFDGWQNKWHLGSPFAPRKSAGELSRSERPPLTYSHARLRWLWLAPVLFFFWANSHGGFVAGFCIYSAYLVCRSIEAYVYRGRDSYGLLRRFALMIVVAGLATLINPYGPGLHLWLIQSLGEPRPEITEWASPEFFTIDAIKLWLIVGLFAAAMFASRKSRDFTHIVIMSLTLWQSLEHLRHLPFFAILFGFWMPMHVQSLFSRFNFAREDQRFGDDMSPVMRRVMFCGLSVAMVLIVGRLAIRATDLQVNKARFPVTAMQFIADHDMNGRMVVTYNWAQYVIGTFGTRDPNENPGIQVAFDGRFRTCYPQEIVDMSFDFTLGEMVERHRSEHTKSRDDGRVLEFKSPDLALLSRGQPHSQSVMEQNTDRWVLLYQDEIAQLWGRRTKYDEPSSPHFIHPADRQISDDVQEGYVTWPALPVRGRYKTQIVKH